LNKEKWKGPSNGKFRGTKGGPLHRVKIASGTPPKGAMYKMLPLPEGKKAEFILNTRNGGQGKRPS